MTVFWKQDINKVKRQISHVVNERSTQICTKPLLSFPLHSLKSVTTTTSTMGDSATGSADKAIQVKLVLLGNKLSIFVLFLCSLLFAGEAAVGKSSVVLRFV